LLPDESEEKYKLSFSEMETTRLSRKGRKEPQAESSSKGYSRVAKFPEQMRVGLVQG
jgi:hypothetical protein